MTLIRMGGMMPRLTSFAPQFLVDDLARSIDYYRKLGFAFAEPWDGFYAIGTLDGLELHLKEAPKNQAERQHRRANEHLDAAAGVDGIEEFHARCVANGVTIVRQLAPTPWGTLDFYVMDPDGYIIAFGGTDTSPDAAVEKPADPQAAVAMLDAFAEAWNRHDADAIMSMMTDDCVFEASAGPDVTGTRYVGPEAVRAGFIDVWTTFPDAHWGGARHFVQGDRGVSEWTFTGTRQDGSRVEVHGCDLFTLRDGKIALKNSYRKNRPPLAGSPAGARSHT